MLAIGPVLVVAATIGLMYSSQAHTRRLAAGVVAAAAVDWHRCCGASSRWRINPLPLPFIAAWLLSIAFLVRTGRLWWAGVAGASLGAGLYMSLPAAIMMPSYVALTVIVGWPSRAISRPAWLVFLGSFSIVAMPYLVSWIMRPEEFREMVNARHLYDANRFNVLQGTREVTSWSASRAP